MSAPQTSTNRPAGSEHQHGRPERASVNLTAVIPEIDPELTASLLSPKFSHPHRHHHHHHHHHHHRQPHEQENKPEQHQSQQQQPQPDMHLQPPHPTSTSGYISDTPSCASASGISDTSTPTPAARAAMDHTGAWQPRTDRRQSWDRQEYKHELLAQQRLFAAVSSMGRKEGEANGEVKGDVGIAGFSEA
ncbi:hypothetical protein VTJ83DRAFT_4603 [Remersonia thermophila]|uniref:Uncharacterized protein n=1 Tax=Remersonia thermophila TaxID=72144 RepID=A0ABR4DAF3_9PEZI